MGLAEEGLRLLDRLGDFDFATVDSTNGDLSLKSGLVDLLDDDALPLGGLQEFPEDFLVPHHRVVLHEVDLAEAGLDLGDPGFLHLSDESGVEVLKVLDEGIDVPLQFDSVFEVLDELMVDCVGCHVL